MFLEKLDRYLAKINLPCALNLLPPSAHLVGGSVRDALLEREKTQIDLDFVLPEKAIATGREIAHHCQGGFVVLDEAREIARVVFPQGTLDLALQVGSSLETDLYRRDFTINAIAYNLQTKTLVDPLNGVSDLEQGILRMVSPANLEDDPLRLLRAYRQAAQLNFTIEANTRKAIGDRASLLTKIAAERVQTELNYIFASPLGNKWLEAAWKDGLIDPWFTDLNREKIQQLTAVEATIAFFRENKFNLEHNCSDLSILAKLATLVASEPAIAEAELTKLKYSRAQLRAVVLTVKCLPQLQTISSLMSLKEQYFFFLEVKDVFPILITRAIATGVSSDITTPLIKRYLARGDRVAHPQPLVTGNDLIAGLNIKPSPAIGKLLTEIQIAYIEDKISTPAEAIKFAASLLKS